jgi:hypothetical protein
VEEGGTSRGGTERRRGGFAFASRVSEIRNREVELDRDVVNEEVES